MYNIIIINENIPNLYNVYELRQFNNTICFIKHIIIYSLLLLLLYSYNYYNLSSVFYLKILTVNSCLFTYS